MNIIDTIISPVLSWITNQGLSIVIICAVSWFLYHFVNLIVKTVIRRVIRPTHGNQLSKFEADKRRKTVAGLMSTVLRVLIIAVATLALIKQVFPNINYTPLFAGAGIVGLALAFGAQSLLKDFMTGLFIITENQYRVGDVVDLDNGAAGTVEQLGIRSTVLRDADGNVHYVPNGNIGHVVNKTMGYSKVNFTLSVHPDTDVDELAQVINDTGMKLAEDPKWNSKITEAPHFMNIGNFSQLGMDVTIVGVTQPSDQWNVTGELRRRLLKEFSKHNIKLATAATPWSTSAKKK